MVLVDYARKIDTERPDFYILTIDDWLAFCEGVKKKYQDRGRIELDSSNCPVWPDQTNKEGKPYRGCGIKVSDVMQHKEKWEKIKSLLKREDQ
jgi:hypothetical protein